MNQGKKAVVDVWRLREVVKTFDDVNIFWIENDFHWPFEYLRPHVGAEFSKKKFCNLKETSFSPLSAVGSEHVREYICNGFIDWCRSLQLIMHYHAQWHTELNSVFKT